MTPCGIGISCHRTSRK